MTWLHTTHAFVGADDLVLHVSAKLRDARSLAHIREHLRGAAPMIELTIQSPLLLVSVRLDIARVEGLINWHLDEPAKFNSGGALTWRSDGLTIDEANVGELTIAQLDLRLIHDVMRSLACEHRQRIDHQRLGDFKT